MRLTDLEGQFVALTHSVVVCFRDRGVPDDATPGPERSVVAPSSRDLSTPTLTPSIALRCWHGFVTRGEAK